MNGETSAIAWDLWRKRWLAVGFIALLLCAGGGLIQPQPFFSAYLTAYVFWIGIPAGSLALLMLHHLVGGRWGFMTQRVLEAAIQTLPFMALLFIPLLFGLAELYPWARAEAVAADSLLQQKSAYLNAPFFIARAAVYFAVWAGLGRLLVHWSLEQDRTADGTLTQRLQRLSGPGLLLWGLTVTFAAIDWVMSLEPKWYSTIFGMIFIVSYGLAALGFVIVVLNRIKNEAALARVISADRFHDLGNLLLALVMLWAYVNYSQFLLIWSENLAEEIPWYLHRISGGWEWVARALVAFLFVLPFVLLLSRNTKRSAPVLARVALLILFMQWCAALWMVAPSFYPGRFHLHWMDIVAPIGIGAVWLSAFIGYLQARSLLPLHDPRFAELVGQAREA
jgi:hypothetical protein